MIRLAEINRNKFQHGTQNLLANVGVCSKCLFALHILQFTNGKISTEKMLRWRFAGEKNSQTIHFRVGAEKKEVAGLFKSF